MGKPDKHGDRDDEVAIVRSARGKVVIKPRSRRGGGRPTIADVALYSYLSSAPEGNVDLSAYPRVNAFLRRTEALPGFVPFAKTAAGLAAAA